VGVDAAGAQHGPHDLQGGGVGAGEEDRVEGESALTSSW
jgi:hypothetical protein